jgi:hypothetical protein
MKLLSILLAPIAAIEMAFTALAGDYKDFAAEGYRWVKSMAHLCALLKRISER